MVKSKISGSEFRPEFWFRYADLYVFFTFLAGKTLVFYRDNAVSLRYFPGKMNFE